MSMWLLIFFANLRTESGPLPAGYTLNGKAYWGLYEREVQLVLNQTKGIYEAKITDIGLKQAFGTDPGWIGLQIRFTFPTQGSLALDTAEISKYISTMSIGFDYYEEIVPQ